jgi:hypothetical protein
MQPSQPAVPPAPKAKGKAAKAKFRQRGSGHLDDEILGAGSRVRLLVGCNILKVLEEKGAD